jgi:hypothetical protein
MGNCSVCRKHHRHLLESLPAKEADLAHERGGTKIRKIFNLMPESTCVVQLSETGVSCNNPNGRIDSMEWDDLNSIEIITTDKGPFLPDVFWVLNGSKTRCVIPWGATGQSDLLYRIQKLPGFRNEPVIDASMSTENAHFLCWQKENLSSS